MPTGFVNIHPAACALVAGAAIAPGETVSVVVRLPTVLRPHAGGQSTVSVQGSTIGEVLADLVRAYPGMAGQVLTDGGQLHRFVNVYVDDDDVRYLDQLDTKVSDGATVSILPAVAGG
jgi:molybdopterin converting factor small subunit